MNAAAAAAGERLAECYREIGRLRMAGLAVCNQALAVEAVGFRALGGEAFGVLVTPWCMNLVLLDMPGAPPRPALPAAAGRDVIFPAGTIGFTVAAVDPFGRVDAASLFSPMHEFADQAAARATALAALEAVLAAPPQRAPGRRGLLLGRGAAA
jgi:[NiFe] hydrogenase assembly HybE family chaperone